jgi:hypothetical protein
MCSGVRPGADLIVEGSKLLALTKTKDGLFIKELAIPAIKSPTF